jgi:hypothetical protein
MYLMDKDPRTDLAGGTAKKNPLGSGRNTRIFGDDVMAVAHTIDEEESSIVFWEMSYCENCGGEPTGSSVRWYQAELLLY